MNIMTKLMWNTYKRLWSWKIPRKAKIIKVDLRSNKYLEAPVILKEFESVVKNPSTK